MGDMFNVLIGKNLASGSGSGGGSATITSLWSSTSGATINTEYTLNDSINNYDAIYLKISTENDVNLSNTFATTSFLTQFYDINQSVEWQGYLQRALTAKFNGNKFTQTVTTSTEGAGYSPKIYQIIGVKFGTGTNTSTTVKTLTYTGDGKDTTSITFPDTPTVILSIDGPGTGTGMVNLSTFRFGAKAVSGSWSDNDSGSTGDIALRADYSGDTLLLTKGQNAGARCNVAGETYTVTYI